MIRFSIHAGEAPKRAVAAVPAVYAGFYDETAQDILQPDLAAVRAALPYRWRRAFDRSGSFWYDKRARIDAAGRMTLSAAHMTLRGYRGRPLAMVYAIPFRESAS